MTETEKTRAKSLIEQMKYLHRNTLPVSLQCRVKNTSGLGCMMCSHMSADFETLLNAAQSMLLQQHQCVVARMRGVDDPTVFILFLQCGLLACALRRWASVFIDTVRLFAGLQGRRLITCDREARCGDICKL